MRQPIFLIALLGLFLGIPYLGISQSSDDCDCVYPIVFVHGWAGGEGSWEDFSKELDGIWGDKIEIPSRSNFSYVDNSSANESGTVYYAHLNYRDEETNIWGPDSIPDYPLSTYSNNPPYSNDDVIVHEQFLDAPKLDSNKCIYAVSFKVDKSLILRDLILPEETEFKINDDDNESDSNEASAYKQGYVLGRAIAAVREVTGKDKVILVAHSMGGLAAREYLQRTHFDKDKNKQVQSWWVDPTDEIGGHKVAKLFTVGTPHRGSNSADFLNIPQVQPLGFDLKSEAIRDLRFSYESSTIPGAYLYATSESGIQDLEGRFKTLDVNCNGKIDDHIYSPLNNPIFVPPWESRSFNREMPLPKTIKYTYYISQVEKISVPRTDLDEIYNQIFNGTTDGVVDIKRQWLFESGGGSSDDYKGGESTPQPNYDGTYVNAEVISVKNSAHTSDLTFGILTHQTGDYNNLARGLDEPDYPYYAYKIKTGKWYAGMANIRADTVPQTSEYSGQGDNLIDGDWYKFILSETAPILNIEIEKPGIDNVLSRVDLFTNQTPTPFSNNGDGAMTMLAGVNDNQPFGITAYDLEPGTYFFRITNDLTSVSNQESSWRSPYKFRLNIQAGPECNNDGICDPGETQPSCIDCQSTELGPSLSYLEYFIDVDPGFGLGISIPISGSSSDFQGSVNIDISQLAPGLHTLYIRAKDENGLWSFTQRRSFYLLSQSASQTRDVVYLEYFLNEDPGEGNGIPIDINPATLIEAQITIPVSELTGNQRIFIRAKDNFGEWSFQVTDTLSWTGNEITVTYPNGGETFDVSTEINNINWSTQNTVGPVNIELVQEEDGRRWTIANNVDPQRPYSAWTIPDWIPSGNYRIKVYDRSDPSILDFSDTPFGIVSPYEPGCNRVQDSLALVVLYNSMLGQSWRNSWNLNQPMDNWNGVVLENGRVVQLDLVGQELTGVLPPEIGNLCELTTLDLRTNKIRGAIPEAIGNLTKLTKLDLWNNDLSGELPASLDKLINLTELILGNNSISGNIPGSIASLTKLIRLDLGYNNFNGTIPEWLGTLYDLTYLALGNNDLTGSIPTQLGNLDKVRFLYLDFNELEGSIPIEFRNLSSIEFLYMSDNQLSGSIPPELSELSNLRFLFVDQNQLSGPIPSSFGLLPRLDQLYIYDNQLEGPIPKELGDISTLVRLLASNNQLIGEIPKELGNLTNLQQLFFDNNQLSGCFPSELMSLCTVNQKDFSNNPQLPWEGDFDRFCSGEPQPELNCVDDGLIAYYPFNSNANDESGNGYNGTVNDATLTTDRFGNPSSAYAFDGSGDYIEVANTDDVFSLNRWTLAAWVKPSSSERTLAQPIIYKLGPGASNADNYGLYGRTLFYTNAERASDGQDFLFRAETPNDPLDTWYHVVGTYDGNEQKIYINGQLDAFRVIGDIIPYMGSTPLRIGNMENSTHGNIGAYDGCIDEVRIYNRALTASEICGLFSSNPNDCITNTTQVEVDISQTSPYVNTELTISVMVLDEQGIGLPNEAVAIDVQGVNTAVISMTTDVNGFVEYSYTGLNIGTDVVTVTASNVAEVLEVIWFEDNTSPSGLQITWPDQGGICVEPGSRYDITWETGSIQGNVILEVVSAQNGEVVEIAKVANTGTYRWGGYLGDRNSGFNFRFNESFFIKIRPEFSEQEDESTSILPFIFQNDCNGITTPSEIITTWPKESGLCVEPGDINDITWDFDDYNGNLLMELVDVSSGLKYWIGSPDLNTGHFEWDGYRVNGASIPEGDYYVSARFGSPAPLFTDNSDFPISYRKNCESSNCENAQISITQPEESELLVGTQISLNVLLENELGEAIANENVNIELRGSNPTSTSIITGNNGQIEFSYQGDNIGRDSIFASACGVKDTIVLDWIFPSLIDKLEVDVSQTTPFINTELAISVMVLNEQGIGLPNEAVAIDVQGVNTAGISMTTDVNGFFEYSYTGINIGTDVITVTAGDVKEIIEVEWRELPDIEEIELSVSETNPMICNAVNIQANALDDQGNGIPGVDISLDIQGVNDLLIVLTTDENGQVEYSYRGLQPGSDFISVTADGGTNSTEVEWIDSNMPQLVALEITQAAQNLKNETILIEGKSTVVRAYLKANNPNLIIPRLSFSLEVLDENDNILGTFTPGNLVSNFSVPLDPIGERNQLESTLNFFFDAKEYEALLSGRRKFRLNYPGLCCNEIAESNGVQGDCQVEVAFLESPGEITFLFYTPTIQPQLGNEIFPLAMPGNIVEELNKIKSILPIADRDIKVEISSLQKPVRLPFFEKDLYARLNKELEAERYKDTRMKALEIQENGHLKTRHFQSLALIGPNVPTGDPWGESNWKNNASLKVDYTSSNPYIQSISQHELLHSFGFTHIGSCGATLPSEPHHLVDGQVYWESPYLFDVNSNSNVATIGGVDQNGTDINFGFDFYKNRVISPFEGDENVAFELMSYCGSQGFNNNLLTNGRSPISNVSNWMSDRSYEQFYGYLKDYFEAGKVQLLNPRSNESDYYLISGNINFNTNEVNLDSFFIYPSSTPPVNETGNYELCLLDQNGLGIDCVSVNITAGAEDTDFGYFTFFYPYSEDIFTVQVKENNSILAEITRTPNKPTVRITSPSQNELLEGSFDLEWVGFDADSDDRLHYQVEISTDGGNTWRLLAINYDQTTLTISTQYIGESDNALIRVQVTDGLNTGEDISELFSIANSPPVGIITAPNDQQEFFNTITVRFDSEIIEIDEPTEDVMVTWYSSLDGELGTGLLNIRAENLSEGRHTITATFEDPDGGVSTEQIEIEIFRYAFEDAPEEVAVKELPLFFVGQLWLLGFLILGITSFLVFGRKYMR